jgi:hypothetical protein
MTHAALTRALTSLVLALASLAGCGGSDGPAARASRGQVRHQPRAGCQASVRAALARLPGLPAKVGSRLVSGDEQSAICAYRVARERLTVEVDADPQAYLSYITTTAHQVPANTGLGGAVPRNDYPRDVGHVGAIASWLPRERQLIATNARYRRGGVFVRVSIHRRQRGAPFDRAVGTLAARAAFRTAPHGLDTAP